MLDETFKIKIVLMSMQIKYRLVRKTTNGDPNKMFHMSYLIDSKLIFVKKVLKAFTK